MGIITRLIPHYTQPQEAAVIRSEYRNNLLGYFPNDGLATPTYPLTFAGNAAYGVTEFGKAILYDGTGDYTSAGDAFYSDEYTILVTFNANVLNADNKGVIVKRNLGTAAGTNELWLEVTASGISIHAWQSGGAEILNFAAAISPVAGKTYTVGIDIPPGSGTAYMYVNGALAATGSKTGTIVNGTADLQFGALVGGAAARYWNGYIGPAAFWSKRRSDTQQLSANPWQILTPRKRQIYVNTATGAQNLTPSLYADGDTFYTPTVAPGAVTITPSLYSDSDTFYSATVALANSPQNLSPALFADADTFHSATVNPGAVNLAPSLYTDADTFYAATVAAGYNLQPAAFADSDAFYAATVSPGAATISPSLIVDGDTFYAATLTGGTDTTDNHDGWLQPVKRRKQSKAVRRELERLFKKAEVVVEKIAAPKPVQKTVRQTQTVDIGLPPLGELQMVLMHMQLIQDQMTEQQMQRMTGLQAQIQRMYNIRARAALLAA